MILLLLGILHLVGGALIADSYTDFGGVQGNKGWYYKNFDGEMISEFPTFGSSWVGGLNSWQNVDTWCQIGEDIMHPTTGGGSTMCNTPVGYCAPILSWSPPQTYSNTNLTVTVTVSHSATFSSNVDGVTLTLQINDLVADTFNTPFSISKTYSPQVINSIDVMLDPKSSCNSDGAAVRIQVYGPDPTPSPSASLTSSASQTRSPSPSATGICNDIFNNLYGKQETVSGDGVVFTVVHGSSVRHSPNVLCGQNPTCVDTGAMCRCTYTAGSQEQGCPSPRTTEIIYTYGGNAITYNGQSPVCSYRIARSFSFPSATPSVSGTPSFTPSSSYTPSPSATGICNDIKNYVNNRLEYVYNEGMQYNVFHGQYITTPYLLNFDMLLGVFTGCTEYGNSCVCNYNNGYKVGCAEGVARRAVVNFTYGNGIQTSYYNQSECVYNFRASYIRPSLTPSQTASSSQTGSWTPTASQTSSPSSSSTSSNTASPTMSATSSHSSTSSPSSTTSPTRSATSTSSPTSSATSTRSPTMSTTASDTSSSTPSQTRSTSATVTPSVTPTGICNDVRNYVFGRRDSPTAEYTIYHGDRMTHLYYPSRQVLIGNNPVCMDSGDVCTCIYGDGEEAFCPKGGRMGIVQYSYDWKYRTFLINDSDPVCVYKFNTTFFLPYLSPSHTRSATPSATATFVPKFVASGVTVLPLPPNFPTIPSNASDTQLNDIATSFVGSLLSNNTDVNKVDALAALASSLAAANGNLTLSVSGEGFTWVMTPASVSTPVNAGNSSVVLPALGDGMVYSFVSTESNSSFPTFSVDALGTAVNKFSINGLSTPLTFDVPADPPTGQTIECVFWNGTEWDNDGCAFVNGTCACTHFTEFSARFAAIADTNANLFGAAGEVYSLRGLKKYAVIYGTLIGLFLGIACVFVYLLWMDAHGENKYRLAVEDIEEVCKILGYEKPNGAQPVIQLPTLPPRHSVIFQICGAWFTRMLYHHSYFGILFRYDPRLPRGFRLLLVATVAFHTLFLTTLLYGYSKVGGTMTIIESIILSVITASLNIPFIRLILIAMNKVGIAEYETRFPDFAHEYNRRRAFEKALGIVPTEELVRVLHRIENGKPAERAIQISPTSPSYAKRNSVTNNVSSMGGDNTDTILVMLLDAAFRRCCPRRVRKAGFQVALQVASESDPHYETPSCNALPTKTFRGCLFSFVVFGYITWIMNYLLLFTASQSTDAMNSIASSFGISQATNIFFTQPLTLFLTLVGSYALSKCKKSNDVNHIGYFADPYFKRCSSVLSGAWAYWIFLYGGSVGSVGLDIERRGLGYSSPQAALAALRGVQSAGISDRDNAITRLYIYLRGIEKPLNARARAAKAAMQEIGAILAEAPQSNILPNETVIETDKIEIVEIVKEIAPHDKDAGSRIIS